MSVVGAVELVAWLLSAVIAAWLVMDLLRVGRHHDEATLVNAPDPLDEVGDGDAPAPGGSPAPGTPDTDARSR